jgi:hypothetical protein
MRSSADPGVGRVIALPWKPGPARHSNDEVVVSATRTKILRWRDLPGILIGGHRLRHRWPRQPGAIELKVALQPLRRVSWTVSVWKSRRDLNDFVRSSHHIAILTPYRDRMRVQGAIWNTTATGHHQLWTQALERLHNNQDSR